MFDIQKYSKANSLDEAISLLAANPEAKLIAGGTDVLVKLRHFSSKFQQLVDIHDLAELKYCESDSGKIHLGSGLTFSDTINSPLIRQHIPVLGEACATVAGPQIRNMGTIGGNIANGATSADTACPMLVLEPQLLIKGSAGPRQAHILGFHTGPGQVALKNDEVLLGFEFDLEKLNGLGACYYKYAMRSAMDIATIGCAAAVRIEAGLMSELKIALTVAAPTPIRCSAAEKMGLGQPVNDESLSRVIKALEEDIKPRTSWRATKEFRTRIIKTLVERMIKAAADRSVGRA